VKLVELLDAAAASARAIARGPLGACELTWSGVSTTPVPDDLCGIYIPLLMEGSGLQLGVLATRDVCASLARSLLVGIEDVHDSDEDVFDAVGEVTNMIAGELKVLLAPRIDVRVGVPLAMKGRVFSLGGSESIHGILKVDRSDVWLVMTGSKAG
jgi:hypothetical protein